MLFYPVFSPNCLWIQSRIYYNCRVVIFSCKIQQLGQYLPYYCGNHRGKYLVGHLEIVSLATLQPGYWSHVSGIIIHNGISEGIFSWNIFRDRLHRIAVQTILAKTLLFFTHQKWVMMFLFKTTIICVNILKASRTIPWWSL